jgi:hypothetical protein
MKGAYGAILYSHGQFGSLLSAGRPSAIEAPKQRISAKRPLREIPLTQRLFFSEGLTSNIGTNVVRHTSGK